MDLLNKSLVLKTDIFIPNISMPIVTAMTYLESFCQTQSELFPIIKEPNFRNKILRLHSLLAKYFKEIINALPNGNNNSTDSNTELFKETVKDIMNCKGEVISALQKFVLDDI